MTEVIALDVVRRAEKRFVFEIMRDNRLAASSDEHKTAKGAARRESRSGSGRPKSLLKEKLESSSVKSARSVCPAGSGSRRLSDAFRRTLADFDALATCR